MALLLILFFFPILFGAKLLGASWLLAAFISCAFYPALIVVAVLVAFLRDEHDLRRKRKRSKQLRAERELRRQTR